MRLDRLTVFNHLWAIAGMCEAARWISSGTGWSWVLLPTSLGLLANPGSIICLAVFALAQVSFHSLAPHSSWNHGLFMALMNVAILMSIVHVYSKSRHLGDPVDRQSIRQAIFDQIAPTLRLSLILLYGFTFLHKLNWDFLDPEYSCAGTVLTWLNTKYRILPTGQWMTFVGIWSALVIESAVPILLCFQRSIKFGFVLGFLFHLFLSQYGGLYGFAAIMYAIYFLFLPLSFTRDLDIQITNILTRLDLERVRQWLSPAMAFGALTTILLLRELTGSSAFGIGLWGWNAWLAGIVVFFGGPLVRALLAIEAVPLVAAWRPLGVVPILVAVNGLCPYLGLKTETSWSMYSNLRTEVRPNHILIPGWIKMTDHQRDLVKVVDTSLADLEEYQRRDELLTFFEFRRVCSAVTEDFRVVYERNGQECTLELANGISSDSLATRPHGWLSAKLLRFRPVDTGAHMKCQH